MRSASDTQPLLRCTMGMTRQVALTAALLALACGESATPPAGPARIVFPRQDELVGLRGQLRLAAIALDSDGDPLLPAPAIEWTSSNGAIASVNDEGIVTGEALGGPVTINASVGNVSASVSARVVPGQIAFVPAPATLVVGTALTLSAQVLDALGEPIPNAPITWANATPAVVSLDPSTLLLTGLTSGNASITASAGGGASTLEILVGVPTALDGTFASSPGASTYAQVDVVFGRVTRFVASFRPMATCSVSITAQANAEIAGATNAFLINGGVGEANRVSGTFSTVNTVNGIITAIPFAGTSCGPTSGSTVAYFAADRQ